MFKKQFGFSILEIVLVIGIISVITVISSNLLTRTYRTSQDAELTSKLKQNGSVALDILSEAIRMADSVVCYRNDVSPNYGIVIRTISGEYWQFRFVDQDLGSGYIEKQEDMDSSSLADPSAFCDLTNSFPAVSITDKDPETGVSISGGEFIKLSDGSGGKHTVTIKFKVCALGDENCSEGVNMQTTVQVR